MSLYLKYPDFIDTDPRRFRSPRYYTVTDSFMQTRHDGIFKNILFEGKTVLDLGCCAGYTGAYALSKGAKFYHGVELMPELCAISQKNFSKYFNDNQWTISNLSLEDFLKNNDQSFDIVVAMNIINAVKEPVTVIESLLKIANVLAIDDMHPSFPGFNLDEHFLENLPFVSYGRYAINYSKTKYNARYYGSRPNSALVKLLFDINGFDVSTDEYEELKKTLPNYYCSVSNKKYVIVGTKNKQKITPMGFLESFQSGNFELERFDL